MAVPLQGTGTREGRGHGKRTEGAGNGGSACACWCTGSADHGTDKWFYGSQSITHQYVQPDYAINAARLVIFTGGQGFDIAGLGRLTRVFLNGTYVGELTDGDVGLSSDNNIARKDIFDLGPFLGLLTGSDTFFFQTPYSGDGWAIDYSELVLQTRSVPEPGSLGLLGLGIVGLALTKRRK